MFNSWFGKSKEDQLLDQIFSLKFTAKQLARTAAKGGKEEKQLKAKVRAACGNGIALPSFFVLVTKGGAVAPHFFLTIPPLSSPRAAFLRARAQVKAAIEKGNIEGAKIYATDSIRKKNEQLNMMKVALTVPAPPASVLLILFYTRLCPLASHVSVEM